MSLKRFFISLLFILSALFNTYGQDPESGLKKNLDKFNGLGYVCLMEGRYDSAEFYYLKTVILKEAYYGPNSLSTVLAHINLASIYRYTLDYEKALEHLDIGEGILKISDPNSKYLGYIYHNKGNIYSVFDDYAEATRYFQHAMDLFEGINLVDSKEFQQMTINYFNSLIKRKMFDSADSLISTIQSMSYDPEIQFTKHFMLAARYEELNLLSEAEEELNKAQFALNKTSKRIENQLKFNHQYAYLKLAQDKPEEAREALFKNLNLLQGNMNLFHARLIYYYYLLSKTYTIEKNYQKSLDITEYAIEKILDDIDKKGFSNSPKFQAIIRNELYVLYMQRAEAALAIFQSTGDVSYLESAHESYTKTIERLNHSRLNMKNEESIILSTDLKIGVFHAAINVAVKLFESTQDSKYLEQSFRYAENSKSFALLSEIKGLEAMEFSDIPVEIKDEEQRYTREISAYEELLFNEQSSQRPDSIKISNFDFELFNLRDDYNTLLDDIENSYPNYFELKYNPHFTTLDEISKKLHRNEALVEYVLADTLLTTYVVDHDNTVVLQQTIDSSFSQECIRYYMMLQSQEFDQDVHKTYREYVRLSRLFYETLVAPVREITGKKEITFVPDGEIMYLPFESFLSREVDDEYIDYMDLPYLIHDLSVAYSYSSTLLFSDRIQNKSPEKKVLAFAPAYDNLSHEADPLKWNRQANPDFLTPLLGAKEEVNNIARRVPSLAFMDYQATERNFKEYASDYSILHLAMHTIMNDQDPMFSRLAFARVDNDTTEDHDLFTYEIYNMNLNASMIVLSSCSSGYGKMQKGEGMMSLSRGFMYAGCPSIIMTLWQVSDRSSADLMSSFYKYLKRGNTKKESLRLAKIDYIKTSDGLKANPYFWSGFVQVGDSTPLYRKTAGFYLVFVLAVFIGLVLYFQNRSKLRKILNK